MLAYFLVFHRLDAKAIHSWDESLFATRAFYLAHHGEYFTNWKDIDHCKLPHPNTKPPLIGFVQAQFFRWFGYSRLSLRLPIAIMGVLLSLILVFWLKKARFGLLISFLSATILLANLGFNAEHVLRSGDHDVALALWLTLSVFATYQFSIGKSKMLWAILIFVLTALAVLTKSIMGFMMLPAIAIYLLLSHKPKEIFSQTGFYLGFVLMAFLVASFYWVMDQNHPGFLQLVWDNEIGGRYAQTIDNHKEPWNYYLVILFQKGFLPYAYFSLAGIFYGFFEKDKNKRKLIFLSAIAALFYLVVISSASTKLAWYAAPLYPLLAVLAAVGFDGIIQFISRKATFLQQKPKLKTAITLALAIGLIAPQAGFIIKRNSTEKTTYKVERYEIDFEKLRVKYPEYKNIKILTRDEWYPSLVFVANKYDKLYGYQIELANSKTPLEKGDLVFGEYHGRMDTMKVEKLANFNDGIYLFKVINP